MTHDKLPSNQREFADLSVYEASADISPFSAFLEHTNEKERVAAYLTEEIRQNFGDDTPGSVLDIGCGDASLACRVLQGLGAQARETTYYGIEPVPFNAQRAAATLAAAGIPAQLFVGAFEEHHPTAAYDVVLASNLYYLAAEQIPGFITRARAQLSDRGRLFFAYRDSKDDLLEFRHRFEAPLYPAYRPPRTIDDVLAACDAAGIVPLKRDAVHAQLNFPNDRSYRDKIIEFLLNSSPEDLPPGHLEAIYTHIDAHDRQLVSAQAVLTFGRE